MDLLKRAMQAAHLGQTSSELLGLLSAGPESARMQLLAEARKLETDADAKRALQ